jgi:scyllo-inositol 2-dehydrogenase (NADP+)
VQLLDAGLDVVTDKAMCLTTAEADAMLGAAARSNRLLSVFHNRRWDWDFGTVRHAIASGWIGELLSAEIAVTHGPTSGWRADPAASGGLLYDWASHLVDQALILGDSRPVRVHCTIRQKDGQDEHAKLVIQFENAFSCSVETGGGHGATIPKPHWFVLGTKGTLTKYGVDPQETAMRAGNIDAAVEATDDRARIVTTLQSVRNSWKGFYQNISDVINGGCCDLAVKPEQVRSVVAVLEAATISARTGQVMVPAI